MSELIDPLPQPKRKRFVPSHAGPFFPLHFWRSHDAASLGVTRVSHRHFTAVLVGDWVMVTDEEQCGELLAANFGKGSLSRFGMSLDHCDWRPWAGTAASGCTPRSTTSESQRAELEEDENETIPRGNDTLYRRQIPRRRFEAHRKWSQQIQEDKISRNAQVSEVLVDDNFAESVGHRDELFVMEDTDSEEETFKNLVVRGVEDPLPLTEGILLMHEEAFFLAFALGCLTVISDSRPLTLLALWRLFSSKNPRFVTRYVAYHYYRSRGWIPRCGLKYGCDFVLYVYGPAHYHGTYCVVVREVDDRMREINSQSSLLSSAASAAASRVVSQVNKDLLFCFVVRSPNFDVSRTSNPRCLSDFSVREILKVRWVPDTERDQRTRLMIVK